MRARARAMAVAVATTLLMVITGVLSQQGVGQEGGIEDIRLVNGTYGAHMGRVEVLYNGTWGTICSNNRWTYPEGSVACRSLGFRAAVCTIPNPAFSPPAPETPVWIGGLRCGGRETSLNQCQFDGFGVDSCPKIGGEVICVRGGIFGKTLGVRQINATPYSVTVTWNVPQTPEGVTGIQWRIFGFTRNNLLRRTTNVNVTSFSSTFGDLPPNTTFSIRVRAEVRYSFCGGYLWGGISDAVQVRTEESNRVSNISVRLVPPFPDVDFFGRIEVLYNDTWGTVCDDNIRGSAGQLLAGVVCRALNFTRALCPVRDARYGPGSGPIWMDNVVCSRSDEFIDDCDFNGWGEHNCDHRGDLSVICSPRGRYVAAVTGFSVLRVGPTSATFAWEPFSFPPSTSRTNYVIRYRKSTERNYRTWNANSARSQVTVNRLSVNSNYSFTIRAQYAMRYCGSNINAAESSSLTVTTMTSAPDGPPTSFHVVVLNNSAVEVQWNLPIASLRNGAIRGFRVFYQEAGSSEEEVITISDGRDNEVIVGGLDSATVYTFSALAYTGTGSDGPRTPYLTVPTYPEDYVELIVTFGPAGNGVDRIVRRPGQRNQLIWCGSGVTDAQLSWFFPNGSEVSFSHFSLRQERNGEGISILRFGFRRGIQYCDAGVYTCRATALLAGNQLSQSRNLTFLVGFNPPAPSTPYVVQRGSSWITLAWFEQSCDGGHEITELVIRYRKEVPEFYVSSYTYVYGLDPSLRNYTIHGLETETPYEFSVQALSAEFRPSTFSEERVINTQRAAPSPPRDVTVRLVSTPIVEVQWREPAVPNGIIVRYTVYGLVTGVRQNQDFSFSDFSTEISVNVPGGHIGVTNVTVPGAHSDVRFQVSATVEVDGEENEGERSEVTSDSTLFVPSPNLPVPQNLRVTAFSNTSVALTWNYPIQDIYVPILNFKVEYTAAVFWTSPQSYFVEFTDAGVRNISSLATGTTISQLVPDSSYLFRVSAVTDAGQGAEVTLTQETAPAFNGIKMSYFQLKITSVSNCFQWKIDPLSLNSIRNSVVQTLITRFCGSCDLTAASIQADSIRCDPTAPDHAVYRGRVTGTSGLNSRSIVSFLEDWVLSNTATIAVNNEVFSVDSTCPTRLDSPAVSSCSEPAIPAPTTMTVSVPRTTVPTTASAPSKATTVSRTTSTPRVAISAQGNKMSSAETGGLVIGVIIAVLLVALIVLLIVLLVRSFWHTSSSIGMKKLNEDVVFTPDFGRDSDTELAQENPIFGETKEKDSETI